jgi:transposase
MRMRLLEKDALAVDDEHKFIVAVRLDLTQMLDSSTASAQLVPECRIIYDKFHILQHASQAVDEVRQPEFFRKGRAARDLVRGKALVAFDRLAQSGSRQAASVEPSLL